MAKDFTPEELIKSMVAKANAIGMTVTNKAKELVPFRTGRMLRSIDYKVEEKTDSIVVHIGTDVDYAKYQEEGTERMKEQGKVGTPENPYKYKSGAGRTATRPFLERALFVSKNRIEEILEG